MELTAQQMVTAGDHHSFTMNILHDFWNKVTQSILNLSSKSKTVCKVIFKFATNNLLQYCLNTRFFNFSFEHLYKYIFLL